MAKAEITVRLADLPIIKAKIAELDGRLATATELLRRVVIDYVPECDPWVPPCTCSAWAAREFLATPKPATTAPPA